MAQKSTNIRQATAADIGHILRLVKELAVFENALDQVSMTESQLLVDGFGPQPRFECLLGEADGEVVAFAMYFFAYSSWRGTYVYLEDLYVSARSRGRGLGVGLMLQLANIVLKNDCVKLQWQCLDWNTRAMDFYVNHLGARERLEDNDTRWLNFILDRAATEKFIAKSIVEE